MSATDPALSASETAAGAHDAERLADTSVAAVLAEAWRDRRTGVLVLERAQTNRRLTFRDGSPVGLATPDGDDRFAQFLEDTRQISALDRSKVESFASERACPQAKAVMAMRLLEAKALYQALRQWTRSQIAELLEWTDGTVCWEAETEEEAATPTKPFDLLGLLQNELPKRWGTDRLFGALVPVSEQVGEVTPASRRVVAQLAKQSDIVRQFVDGLQGARSIGQLLGSCAGDPEAAATLWVLIHAGLIRLRDAAARAGEETFEFEVIRDEKPVQPASSAASSGRASGSPEAMAAREDRAASPKAEALRAEVESLLSQLEEISHYEALGLEPDASPTEIKKAYFKAAKKYHPDALARLGLDAIRDQAAEVFARIARAFETLSDKDKKAVYDSGGAEPTEIDTARLAQAETAFRKGEILVRMGNFQGALEYLESAVELWPEEPAYQSHLGWALYKQPKPDAERARLHLETALEGAPEDPIILFRLGMVLRAHGEDQRSSEMIERARSIQPGVTE